MTTLVLFFLLMTDTLAQTTGTIPEVTINWSWKPFANTVVRVNFAFGMLCVALAIFSPRRSDFRRLYTNIYQRSFAIGCIINTSVGFNTLASIYPDRRCESSDTMSVLVWVELWSFIPLVADALYYDMRDFYNEEDDTPRRNYEKDRIEGWKLIIRLFMAYRLVFFSAYFLFECEIHLFIENFDHYRNNIYLFCIVPLILLAVVLTIRLVGIIKDQIAVTRLLSRVY